MESFPLLTLGSKNLYRVIRKLPEERYVYLQQTCQEVIEFIQMCPKMLIHFKGRYELHFDENTSIWSMRCCSSKRLFGLDAFLGARLEVLNITKVPHTSALQKLCFSLKKNGITAQYLTLESVLSTEDLLAVTKLLETPFFTWDIKGKSDVSLKPVELKLAPAKDILAAVDKSLRAADKVNLIVKKWTSDPVALLFSIWQIFVSIPRPNLRSFEISICYNGKSLSQAVIKRKLADQFGSLLCRIDVQGNKKEEEIVPIVEVPPHVPGLSSFKLFIKDRKVYSIRYQTH